MAVMLVCVGLWCLALQQVCLSVSRMAVTLVCVGLWCLALQQVCLSVSRMAVMLVCVGLWCFVLQQVCLSVSRMAVTLVCVGLWCFVLQHVCLCVCQQDDSHVGLCWTVVSCPTTSLSVGWQSHWLVLDCGVLPYNMSVCVSVSRMTVMLVCVGLWCLALQQVCL